MAIIKPPQIEFINGRDLTDEELEKIYLHSLELERAQNEMLEKQLGITDQDREIRAACEDNLISFAKYSWNILEPKSREMKTGWALDAIADHLTAITDGEINRLVVSVPPGFMKSMLTKIFWPAWEWGPLGRPDIRYVTAAYADHLSTRDARKMKLIVTSPWFQKLWPSVVISSDQAQKANFHNTANGFMLGTSVGGLGTGERGDRFICDDPNSVREAESQAVREGTNQWFLEVVPTRLNSEESAILVIQQRTHEEDVTGTIIEHELDYCHLSIPMEFDGRKYINTLGWQDPREEEGELAWPERFPAHIVKELKDTLGPYATASQLQQMPSPRGGGIIKEEWWQAMPEAQVAPGFFPDLEFIVGSVDTAYSEKEEADYSAMTTWGVFRDVNNEPKVVVMDAWQEKVGLHELVLKIARTAKAKKIDRIIIENKASGISVSQELRRLFGSEVFGVTLLNPSGDKVARMMSVEPIFADKIVYYPLKRDAVTGEVYPPKWVNMLVEQVGKFPKGRYKDLCDTVSQGLKFLRDNGLAVLRTEYVKKTSEEETHKSIKKALYDV